MFRWTSNGPNRQDLGWFLGVCVSLGCFFSTWWHSSLLHCHFYIMTSVYACFLWYMGCISLLAQYNKGVESIFVGFAWWIPTIRAIDCSSGDKPLRSNSVPLIDCQVNVCVASVAWPAVKTHLPLPTLKFALTFHFLLQQIAHTRSPCAD